MAQAAIRPTVTQKVRRFLAAEGVEVKPWAGLDATYVELYRLMNRRRGDPAFWGPLAGLLRDVVEDVTDPQSPRRLAAPHAELLSGWEVRSLVDDLRRALPGDGTAEPTTVRRFGAKLPASVLGGFLLLGLAAVGCNDDPSDGVPDAGDAADGVEAADEVDPPADVVDAPVDTGICTPVGDTTWAAACELPSSSILWCSIATSSIDPDRKDELCGCFAGLSASWNEGLTALFATEPPAVVAQALEDMLRCVCLDPDLLAAPFPEPRPPSLLDLCGGIPIYKGVDFD